MHPYFYAMQKVREILQSKLIRYFVVGGLSGILNYGIFSLFYLGFGVQYAIATIIGGVGAWAVNFPLHKWWTFGDQGRTKTATSLQTVSHASLKVWNNFVAAPLLVTFLVEYVGMPPMVANPLAGITLGLGQNYPVSRWIIFRRPPK